MIFYENTELQLSKILDSGIISFDYVVDTDPRKKLGSEFIEHLLLILENES